MSLVCPAHPRHCWSTSQILEPITQDAENNQTSFASYNNSSTGRKTKTTTCLQWPPKLKKCCQIAWSRRVVDLAKLQTSMLKLFYVNGVIDWEEETVKDINLITFAKGFCDHLAKLQQCRRPNSPICSTHFQSATWRWWQRACKPPRKIDEPLHFSKEIH